MNAKVVWNSDVALQDLGGGTSRKVLAYNEQIMVVEVHFEKGAQGAKHQHPHVQGTYVKSGSFRFCIDGEDVEVKEGDSITFEPNAVHGTTCLEAGVLIDVFTPMRKDFV